MAKTKLSKKFIEEMREKLLKEKEKLELELAKFAKKNPHVLGDYDATFPEYGDKDDENAQEVAQYTARKPLEITMEKTLRDVNNTLKSIEEGAYGVCKYCKEPMSEARLRARPTSSACVSCKKTLTNEL